MQTFNEWMNFRSPHQRPRDWTFVTTDKEGAKTWLEENLPRLFRDAKIDGPYDQPDAKVYLIKGDPKVTVFELEELGITQDLG